MFSLILIAFTLTLNRVIAVDLTFSNCKLDTRASKNTNRLLLLTIKSNPDNVPKTEFEILAKKVEIDLQKNLKVFIKIMPTEDETFCQFEGSNVVLTAEIKAPNDLASLGVDETIMLANGNMKIGVVSRNRAFVPLTFETPDVGNKVSFDSEIKIENVELVSATEHIFSVPKSIFDPPQNMNIELIVKDGSHVKIKNLMGIKAPVASKKELFLTCLGLVCPIEFEQLAEGVKMNVLLITPEANYEPKLVVEPNSGAKAFPLKKDVLQVIRYAKAEIPNQLKVRFEFKTNSILEPHQLRLTNVGSLDKTEIRHPVTIYEGLPTNGIYGFNNQVKVHRVNLKLLNPEVASIEFSIFNDEAVSPDDSKKIISLEKNKETPVLFFKDQLPQNNRIQTEFKIQNDENQRVEIQFVRDNSENFEIETGKNLKLKTKQNAILRKLKNTPVMTLVLELLTKEKEAVFMIGELSIKVKKRKYYHYVREEDFKNKEYIECRIVGDQEEINIFKLNTESPFPILRGSFPYFTSGPFIIKNPNLENGVTLIIKSPGAANGPASLEITIPRLNSKEKFEVEKGSEKTVFLYPEDLIAQNEVSGTLTLTGSDTVNIECRPQIVPIEMEPGKVEVRKNAVILSSNDPVKAHILDVKFEEESKAKTLKVKAGKNEIALDSSKREGSLILEENFINRRNLIEFSTEPSTDKASATLKLLVIDNAKCVPACKEKSYCVKEGEKWTCARGGKDKCDIVCIGNRDCVKEGGKWTCVCKPGFTGQNCDEDKCAVECKGNRDCVKQGEKWACACKPGYSGPDCQKEDKCDIVCNGNRDCVKKGGKWTCVCKPGFTGQNCDEDKCAVECKGNRDCVKQGEKWACACKPGYSGPDCQKGSATGKRISLLLSVVSIIISFLAF